MQKAIGFLAMIVIGLCLPSCSSVASYNIKVNGYTDPGAPAQVKPGGSFFVMENKEAKNPLLEVEVKGKITQLLATRGYAVTTFEKADYYLFFGYGMGEPRSVNVATPDYYGSVGWGMGYGRGGWGGWGGPSVYVGMPWGGYAADGATLYDRWLLINVVEGPAYRTQKLSRPVWVGEAHSLGSSSDLRTVLNYLLVADFKEFGKNTGKAVTMEISAQDPEVAPLTR
ncbi:MAG: hypothetical protein A2139_06710 [Desulfobacca sp. RBG_16_60_12]|nr:MAG: hypothetical protein A2139_06710 [Desulfobacca sp. RBG_16_60_12]